MRKMSLLLLSAAALAGCQAAMPTGPSVAVMPAPGKPFAVFQQENAECMQYASTQVGPDASHAGQKEVAAGAATGAILGAVAGAAMGDSSRATGTGAGAGLLLGSAIGAGNAQQTGNELQRRYDIAYEQCMYAKGNQLPSAPTPTYQPRRYQYSPPPPPPGYY